MLSVKVTPLLLLLQILTLWQRCVAICQAFPESPDVLAMVNAVANDGGEPLPLSASCLDDTPVDKGAV